MKDLAVTLCLRVMNMARQFTRIEWIYCDLTFLVGDNAATTLNTITHHSHFQSA